MEFKYLDPLLHNELRLKIMAALDSLDDADFVYLKGLTGATSGVCRITPKGSTALQDYQKALMSYFSKK